MVNKQRSLNNEQKRILGTWLEISGSTWVFSDDGCLTTNKAKYRCGITTKKLAIMENPYGIPEGWVSLSGPQYNPKTHVFDISFASDGYTLILTGDEANICLIKMEDESVDD